MTLQHRRTPEIIKSDINRVKANIEQVQNMNLFTDKDTEILIPRYQGYLEEFKKELAAFVNAAQLEVIDPEILDVPKPFTHN